MGIAVQAVQTRQTIADYTNVVNMVVDQAINEASTTTEAFNFAEFNFGEPPCLDGFNVTDSTINITQTASVNSNLSSVNRNDFTSSIKNNLQTETEIWINNHLQENQGWLAFAVGVATANNVSVTQISQDLSNSVSNDVINQCSSELSAGNRGIVNLCGTFGSMTFNFGQDAAITNLTSCINNNVFNTVLANNVLNNIIQQTNNHFLTQQEGIFSGLRWLIVAAVVLGALIIIGVLLYFIFGGSSKPKEGEVSPKTLEREDILRNRLKRKHELERNLLSSRQELERSAFER